MSEENEAKKEQENTDRVRVTYKGKKMKYLDCPDYPVEIDPKDDPDHINYDFEG